MPSLPRTPSPSNPPDGRKVVIVGAGPAGLTAAYQLAKAGRAASVVLEADDMVGGISRTAEYKGLPLRHRRPPLLHQGRRGRRRSGTRCCGDEFLVAAAHVADLLQRQVLRLPAQAPRTRSAASGRRAASLRPRELPAVPGSARCRHEENFEQWVSNRFGKRLYEIFFKTYTEKVWGIPCTEISAPSGPPSGSRGCRCSRGQERAAPAAHRRRQGERDQVADRRVPLPAARPGQMWETVAERSRRARQRGDDRRGRGPRCCTRTAASPRRGRGRRAAPSGVAGSHFISTMPLRELVRSSIRRRRPTSSRRPTSCATATS